MSAQIDHAVCLRRIHVIPCGALLFLGFHRLFRRYGPVFRFFFIFQQYNLLPRLNLMENVEVPLVYAGIGRAERHARAKEVLEQVGLGDKLRNRPNQLSGGQQQRVSIARALVRNPAVILADEPTGALDSHTGREVLGMLQQMHDEGHTVVLITHDNSIAVQADRIIRLEDGRVVYDGDAHAPEAVVQPTLLPETPDEEEKA